MLLYLYRSVLVLTEEPSLAHVLRMEQLTLILYLLLMKHSHLTNWLHKMVTILTMRYLESRDGLP